MRRSILLLSTLLMILIVSPLYAADSLSVVSVEDQSVDLSATMGIDQVKYFTLDSPKRLVVDLYGVKPGNHPVNYSLGNGFNLLRVGPLANKTRFVFDVTGSIFPTFNVSISDDRATVKWSDSQNVVQNAKAEPATSGGPKITAIDFNAVNERSVFDITLSKNAVATDLVRDGNKVQFALKNTTLPRSLRREFDTLAFPSAIHSVTPYLVNASGQPEVRFVVLLKGTVPYYLQKTASGYRLVVEDGAYARAYETDTGQTAVGAAGSIDSRQTLTTITNNAYPQSANSSSVDQSSGTRPAVYTGEKTSLVFDNADVKDILRLIAEISDLNIITSDSVKGNITLRLIDVPWDQALDLILDMTGLGMIQEGNVVRVLPESEIRSKKEAALTAARSQEKLESLETEVITVSYADLASVAAPAKDLLSNRGKITQDSRNKLLIITDVASRIDEAKKLITILDTPERQVMIEARIVQVTSSYSRNLGVNWGFYETDSNGNNIDYTNATTAGGSYIIDTPSISSGLGSMTATSGLGSQFVFNIGSSVLDLQLSALETDGKAKVISTPRVTTLNGETATISQGTSIPYESSDSDGVATTEFVDAELKLEVTPVINPDDSIILEILATNDSPSTTTGADAPSIDTKQAETKVLIRNGETTVIGGIFVESTSDSDTGVPGLKNVPIIGNLFKSQSDSVSKDELLIFITPRIVELR